MLNIAIALACLSVVGQCTVHWRSDCAASNTECRALAMLLLDFSAATAFRPSGARAGVLMGRAAAARSRRRLLDPKSEMDTAELRKMIASLKSEVKEKDDILAEKDSIIESMRDSKGGVNSEAQSSFPDDVMAFFRELSLQPATEQRGSVDFMKYDDKYVKPPVTMDPADREVLLYIPGLDFSGISGCSSFPALAARYELWRCRVESDDRSTYSELESAIGSFVKDQISRGKNVTLMGESTGGILAVGVAERLVKEYVARGANASGLVGAILVNPATSYYRSPISVVGPALTTLPAEKFSVPFLPDAEMMAGSVVQKAKPQTSLYSVVGGAVLAASVPSVPQIVNGFRGLVEDVLSQPSSSSSVPVDAQVNELAKRASTLLVGLDSLAERLDPATLSWRLENWLGRGSEEVNAGLRKLKDKGVSVLVIAGDQDRMLPSVDEAQRLERILGPRTCQYVVLKDTGHAALNDQVDILKILDNSPVWN